VDLFKVPLGNFERGSMTQVPYIIEQGTEQIAVGLMICYEDVLVMSWPRDREILRLNIICGST
jgi:apolipoprotein N-acyltransferase